MALPDSTGTTLECLKEFSINNGFQNVSKIKAPIRRAVCAILNIGPQTGREWFDKFTLPIGPNLIRLQILLEFMGYTVTERAVAGKLARRIADYLIFCEISPDELARRVGATEQTVLRWMSSQVPTDDKAAQLEDILQEAEPLVEAGKQAWVEQLDRLNLTHAPIMQAARAIGNAKKNSEHVHRTLRAMENIVADLQKIASPQCSIDDREIFFKSGVTERLTSAVDKINLTYMMKDLRSV